MKIEWRGMTDAEVAKRNRDLLPKRKARVERLCCEGHDFDARERCRRCSYFLCELRAWGLA